MVRKNEEEEVFNFVEPRDLVRLSAPRILVRYLPTSLPILCCGVRTSSLAPSLFLQWICESVAEAKCRNVGLKGAGQGRHILAEHDRTHTDKVSTSPYWAIGLSREIPRGNSSIRAETMPRISRKRKTKCPFVPSFLHHHTSYHHLFSLNPMSLAIQSMHSHAQGKNLTTSA